MNCTQHVIPTLANANPIRKLLALGLAANWKTAYRMTKTLDGKRIDQMIAKAEADKTARRKGI